MTQTVKRKRPRKAAKKAAKQPAEKGQWVTKHPNPAINKPLYKVISIDGKAKNGGKFNYGKDPVGKVFEIEKDQILIMCESGFHLTSNPSAWGGKSSSARTFLAAFWLPASQKAEADMGPGVISTPFDRLQRGRGWCLWSHYPDDKIVCRRIKILAEVKPRVVRAPKLPVISIRKGKDGVPVVSVTDAVPGVLGLSAAKPKKGTPTRATIDAKLAKGLAALKAKKKEVAKAAAALSKEADRLRKRAGQLEDTSYELEDAMDGLPEALDLFWE